MTQRRLTHWWSTALQTVVQPGAAVNTVGARCGIRPTVVQPTPIKGGGPVVYALASAQLHPHIAAVTTHTVDIPLVIANSVSLNSARTPWQDSIPESLNPYNDTPN
ncbi:hypothetical protein PCASD_06186 [Puccinia coronata f. sp. avenae]|uniref:Uncharacterized protein n=1 Tax=Puccinia coronata f. sp. avenae TaxID=200324 RepID=A0A2N5TGI0_9BASI|nr:hypothetical protein PCASD_06186 [Puccinia coronata f. sp. avenae]